jgi:hypothetical protein
MKKTRYIASALGTAAVWGMSVFLILDLVIVVTSVLDLLFAGLVLSYATVATAVVWWMPRVLRGSRFGDSSSATPPIDVELPARPLSRPSSATWWKLAFVSAAIDVVTLPAWVILHFGLLSESFPIPLVVPLSAVLALPVLYLMTFAVWHWRTRYAGRHHLAWLILFVITAWPLFQTLPASVFVALAYCVVHLVPDARGRGAYATPPAPRVRPPASPLPRSYRLAKSACFVLGWVLVVGGVLAAAITCVTDIAIWNLFQDTIPNETGKVLTESKASALWVACQIAKTTSITCLLSALAAAAGAILIQISQRLRWRLLDEQDRQIIMKSIQQSPSTYPEGRADAPSGSAEA